MPDRNTILHVVLAGPSRKAVALMDSLDRPKAWVINHDGEWRMLFTHGWEAYKPFPTLLAAFRYAEKYV